MSDLFKYRVWCNTENTWINTWSETTPTVCPNNNSHEIDSNKTLIVEKKLDKGPVDQSGKTRVHQTSRKLGTRTCFVGTGDNPDDSEDIGNGERFMINHNVDDATTQISYFDLNYINNESWIHEGYIIWDNAIFDCVTLEVVPRVTNFHIDSTAETNYQLYNNYLIIPAAGDGNVVIDSDLTSPIGGLIYMPNSDLGEPPTAFWHAEYNSTTKQFENITPAPYGNGRYNLFAVEVPFAKFVNKIPLLGHGFQRLQSSDVDQLGHGMRFKFTAETYLENGVEDHLWRVAFAITFHREKTC